MGLWELFVIALGLSMDAFAVSICKGLSVRRCTIRHMLICGLYFGLFQGAMPLIGYLIGGIDLSALNITLSPAVLDEAGEVVKDAVVIGIGTFLTTVIDFILVAFVVFLVVKAFNTAKKKLEKPAEPETPPEEPEPTKEELLLTEIRDLLKKQ